MVPGMAIFITSKGFQIETMVRMNKTFLHLRNLYLTKWAEIKYTLITITDCVISSKGSTLNIYQETPGPYQRMQDPRQ